MKCFSQHSCISIFSEENSCLNPWLKYQELRLSFKSPSNNQHTLLQGPTLRPFLVCRSNMLPFLDEKIKFNSSSAHRYLLSWILLFHPLSFCIDCWWMPHILMAYLLHTLLQGFQRVVNSEALWGQRWMMPKEGCFSSFPTANMSCHRSGEDLHMWEFRGAPLS